MARANTVYDYYFREGTAPELLSRAKLNYECTKIAEDGDGIPENTYHIWGDTNEELICDCPASYHHAAKGPCKHVQWTQRWLRILEDQKKQNQSFIPVYYSARDDAFYKLPSAHLEDEEFN